MREPRYPLPRVVLVSKEAQVLPGTPRTGRGRQAIILVFLGAFRAGVRYSPSAHLERSAGEGRELPGGGSPSG